MPATKNDFFSGGKNGCTERGKMYVAERKYMDRERKALSPSDGGSTFNSAVERRGTARG
jgi:hypothetical protein